MLLYYSVIVLLSSSVIVREWGGLPLPWILGYQKIIFRIYKIWSWKYRILGKVMGQKFQLLSTRISCQNLAAKLQLFAPPFLTDDAAVVEWLFEVRDIDMDVFHCTLILDAHFL